MLKLNPANISEFAIRSIMKYKIPIIKPVRSPLEPDCFALINPPKPTQKYVTTFMISRIAAMGIETKTAMHDEMKIKSMVIAIEMPTFLSVHIMLKPFVVSFVIKKSPYTLYQSYGTIYEREKE